MKDNTPNVAQIEGGRRHRRRGAGTSLHRHIEAGAFEQAAKVADNVLKVASEDEDAVQCKMLSYIKVDRIDKALTVIRAAEHLLNDLSCYKVTRLVLSCSRSTDGSICSLVFILYLTH